MLLVTFDKVPKGAKKYFQFKHKLSRKSPELDIKTADDAVKDYAKSLEEADSNVTFTIFDDEDEDREESSFEAQILPEDQDGGILNLIDRDLENENLTRDQEETVTTLKDQIFNELEPSLSDDEEDLNKDNGFMFNNNQILDSDDEVRDEIPPENDVNDETEDNSPTEESNSNAATNPSLNNVPTQLPEEVDALPIQAGQTTETETSRSEVISYGKYTDANDILDRLPRGYDKNQFALNNIRHDLGYLDNPKDQYDQALNDKIDQALRDYSMQDIQRVYDEGLAKSKAAIVDRLKEAYNRVTKESLDKIVEDRTAAQIQQLVVKATHQKQNNQSDLSKLKENKALELKTNDEAALAEYKKQLEEKRNIALKNFNDQEELKTRNANEQIDEQLKADKAKVERVARDEEVQKRNSELDDSRTTISNDFDHAVRNNYDKNNDLFEDNLKKVQEKVRLAKEQINQQKQLDQEKAEEKRQREAEAARKERELDLKQKAIEQNESLAKLQQENMAKLPEEFAKAIAAAITQNNLENPNVKITLNNDGKNALVPVPHVDGEIVDLDDTKKNDAPIDSESNEEDSELKPETEDNSPKKHHYKSEIISLVCLAAATLGGTWAYTNNHSNNEQKASIERSSSNSHVKKNKQSSSKQSAKKDIAKNQKTNAKSKTKSTPTYLTRSQAILKQYRETKTWAQKRDMLDGLLGQGDARNLKKIATIYSNPIASLYSAIANEDKAQTRDIWLSLTDDQRTEISNSAKKAVALAFYDIADWQDGWLARYAY
ncbi:hypothetical protein F1B97_03450 [Lactobacillus crispatus]|uniref:Uncharacterized protein n=1 Tax=Lactobacillus crispatus TaxID=47770 RepID=A0A5M9Z304_9LACO|nr:hypothetical protein [Lactobacillus crispatus]KAA8803422.1 hypothetical protein F1B97_03450 [Lactobacillus crispatus]KAA8813080.1 hypothetical protein F1C09_03425 [Lactobacillus crispatus]MBW9142804.1 hypothetical protein [Lactobacillus crispatus]ORE85668.1 hypothetical protein B6C82_04030 [Lactobacillus crispatus]QWW28400.1 hypothetical protein J6L97_07385 [Lactobacillus crispatus]